MLLSVHGYGADINIAQGSRWFRENNKWRDIWAMMIVVKYSRGNLSTRYMKCFRLD
jgi:hypothetical protein